MFHLKHFSSATCNLKFLSYWNISCVWIINFGYRNSSSILPSQRYTFWQWFYYVIFINYLINFTVSFHWASCFFLQLCNCSLVFATSILCDFFIILFAHATVADFKGTVMQIENLLIKSRLCVSKVSWKFRILTIYNCPVFYHWNFSISLKRSLILNSFHCLFCL